MLRCGLLGKKLGHSYSPAIHSMLADYEYLLYEKTPEQLEDFILHGEWDGLNVTIPYKKDVLPLCSWVSETARSIGSANTLVKKADGSILADNTDVYGFLELVRHSGIKVEGEKALVLGSGGSSVSVCAALRMLGALPVVISRTGENNYSNLDLHADAGIIVNTTPVGMYPDTGRAAVDLRDFPSLKGVFDIIYNPARTQLLLQAESLGIPCANGLYMLVAQAKRSSELFSGRKIEDGEIARVEDVLKKQMRNIVLIGMPGCGKSTIAEQLGQLTGREVLDADTLLAQHLGESVPEYLTREGEDAFRRQETHILGEITKLSGKIISTGGGCIMRDENYALLHQNGIIVWIDRALDKLACEGRPLSQKGRMQDMYELRRPRYEAFADVMIENDAAVQQAAQRIVEAVL